MRVRFIRVPLQTGIFILMLHSFGFSCRLLLWNAQYSAHFYKN